METFTIRYSQPVAIFPTITDMQDWINLYYGYYFAVSASACNGIILTSRIGKFSCDYTVDISSTHVAYVRMYGTPITRPDIPFPYRAWAIVIPR